MGFFKKLFGGGGSSDDDASGARAGAGGATGGSGGGGGEEDLPLVSGPVTDGDPSLHRVVAWIRLNDPTFESTREQLRMFALEDRCMKALFDAGAGDLDTNELDRGYLALRFQGRDADAMAAILAPLMGEVPPGSYLAVRRGPYGAAEDRIDLPAGSSQPAA
ncbi:MAG: hypothetical protein U0869_11635 [Chloroflexota bacterium]